MASSLHVEKDSGVAVVSAVGELRLDDARQAAEKLWSVSGWSGESAVWDFRAAEFDVSLPAVREIANFILENQREVPPTKMAFVTRSDFDFGVARMFEVFRDDPQTTFRVFRDYEQAISWARSPDFGAISGDGAPDPSR